MSDQPIIGTATQTLEPIPGQTPMCWIMGQRYIKSLVQEGAVPWPIPLLMDDEATLRAIYDRLDGVFLTGGVDVDPSFYEENKAPECGRTDLPRDWTEIRLIRWCIADHKPLFGVCRGVQVINVAVGGTLFQDVQAHRLGSIKHDYFPNPENSFTRDMLIHKVRVDPSTRLAGLLGAAEVEVNSMHHQGIKELGQNLVASAWSPDGLIEGLEGTNGSFLLGVQWHPEELTESSPPMRRLFAEFIDAARQYRRQKAPIDLAAG
ncbi:MAG TPA: gamma-glutamyl-gamma-aminobutyrate hydrolase family protein [Gemmatales bacterium]|nr:gamma-glutamyl-gamma-aminobutyrate hydrolase family protein [Gemmatales bacterium]HMP60424.1 gamma-glutamyl-gamma-aminobutyrate hydrolase family protein [Gemmatales bacterium]